MTDTKPLILHDIASKDGTGWAPSPWRTRLVLNYKSIPYKTNFIRQSQLEEALKATGVPPAETPNLLGSTYTVPAITFPGPPEQTIMDSLVLAKKLESLQPTPSLHLDLPHHVTAQTITTSIIGPLVVVFLPFIAPLSQDIDRPFADARLAAFSAKLDQSHESKEAAWEAVKPAVAQLRELLTVHKKDEGPFILGSEVSYGDFVIVAVAIYLKKLDQATYERFLGLDSSIKALVEGASKWSE